MGLDIYVRWDTITDNEQNAQYTGMRDAPDVGYLRFNWAGVRFMREFSAEHNAPEPIKETFQDWYGSNGEGYPVTRDKLHRLLAYQSRLEGWLVEHPPVRPLDDDWEYYYRKIQAWIKLIDFIHSKIDEPGLAVVYG